MHAGKKFSLFEAIVWTRRDIGKYIALAAIPVALYDMLDWKWLSLPWLPIALIGTAVAFLVGFKNNATYDRLWEARKIWGAIVNSSRTLGIMVNDYVTNKHAANPLNEVELKAVHKRIIYRHIGWLTALRFQLRQPRPWETMSLSYNKEYRKLYPVPELESKVEDVINPFLSAAEKEYVFQKKNPATHIISLQSKELKQLLDKGLIEDFRHMELENILADLYEHQGKCERIKNFPYPRQFATLNLYFVWLFILLLPFGMLREFGNLGDGLIWLTIPFSSLVAWVFHTLEKIGESTENPFQGGANDIPMASLARTIEIDLREMLDETDLPQPVQAVHDILM